MVTILPARGVCNCCSHGLGEVLRFYTVTVVVGVHAFRSGQLLYPRVGSKLLGIERNRKVFVC